MTPAPLRPASTVVLVREPEPQNLEILLVRRHDSVAFMAGAYVFPGGRVDDTDRALAAGDEELAYRMAAVRETREEAAVTLAPGDLIPIAHWVTPEIETRRYDTRFFLALMPAGQVARHDESETTELVWGSPSAAIERCRRGEIVLPPPTWTTLRRLTRFRSVAEALDWARQRRVVRVQPQFNESGNRRMLTLPGDPLYPTIPGWDVPEETRFVLEEGMGWKPVPA
jgi:8-oxo-dGTP pyrophosphatase MutT (NUDIX family)